MESTSARLEILGGDTKEKGGIWAEGYKMTVKTDCEKKLPEYHFTILRLTYSVHVGSGTTL